MKIQYKYVYDPTEKSDGYRVLVDRLWPRGIRKADFAFNEWDKALTPSSELRKASHAELIDFLHFSKQYHAKLAQQQREGKRLTEIVQQQTLILLYATKNAQQSHTLVLAEWLRQCRPRITWPLPDDLCARVTIYQLLPRWTVRSET